MIVCIYIKDYVYANKEVQVFQLVSAYAVTRIKYSIYDTILLPPINSKLEFLRNHLITFQYNYLKPEIFINVY